MKKVIALCIVILIALFISPNIGVAQEQGTGYRSNVGINTTVIPGIIITFPAGGENLVIGNTYLIKWIKSGIMSDVVKIRLYQNCKLVQRISDHTFNDGEYSWTIPELWEGSGFTIVVATTDNAVTDTTPAFQLLKVRTIYASQVNYAWRWDWHVRSLYQPDNLSAIQPYCSDYKKTDPLIALNFNNWTLPAGVTITNVKVGARVAWEQPWHGSYLWMTAGDMASGWIQYVGNTLRWVEMDITSTKAVWTKADVDALQVSIKRRWVDTPNSDFFVDAFKIEITTAK